MAIVRGCEIPEQLHYAVDHSVWARQERDGSVVIGFAAPGCVALGEIRSYSPRKVGTVLRRGMSCATLESVRWVEPARSPVAGTVVDINRLALDQPLVINRDPYGSGWLVRVVPDDWGQDAAALVTGKEALAQFERLLAMRAAEAELSG